MEFIRCLLKTKHSYKCLESGDEHPAEGSPAENHVDGAGGVAGGGAGSGRKPLKSGMKELAVLREKVTEQHRQLGKVTKHHHQGLDDKKLIRPRTPCQQELDQVLERISTLRLPEDERGPLEHLYSLHIPNCDRQGLYNLKQCKMSVNGQRGECWCVNPNTGKLIQGAPTVRGDPQCHLFHPEPEGWGGAPAAGALAWTPSVVRRHLPPTPNHHLLLLLLLFFSSSSSSPSGLGRAHGQGRIFQEF
ncbi:insulin-like growth factor-binding protein 2 [Tachyglossus aculeatus]|uniref:insulin-like growth factor-binding protein 2 n=1 Tax=Tachyglossus aculeatus TaxID=9261 RepID=UPI0018F5398B|nr:insulin-like growth factor-binding protein 2 [Tachyglossus aculeatus]